MTFPIIPYQIPNVQSGRVINDPGIGGVIQEGLAGVMKAMQDKEKLRMEREQHQSQMDYYKTRKEGDALENEKKRRELKDTDRKFAAREAANGAYAQWVGSGADKNSLGKIAVTLKDPDAAQEFLNHVEEHYQTLNQAALAQGNTADADVKSATTQARIATEHSQASTAANQAVTTGAEAQYALPMNKAKLRTENAQAAYYEAQANTQGQMTMADTDAKAMNLWKTGKVSAKDAWGRYGASPPAGMDPASKWELRGMQQFRMQSKMAAAQIQVDNNQMDQLIDSGVRISPKTAMALKLPADQGRRLIPDDQQQLLAAGASVMSQYALMMTGKAMTDNEAQRLAVQISPQTGDQPDQIASKSLRRAMILQVTYDAAKGDRNVSEIVGDVIRLAKTRGMPPDFIRFLEKSQMDAKATEKLYSEDPEAEKDQPPVAGTQPVTADSVANFFSGYGR